MARKVNEETRNMIVGLYKQGYSLSEIVRAVRDRGVNLSREGVRLVLIGLPDYRRRSDRSEDWQAVINAVQSGVESVPLISGANWPLPEALCEGF